jgi:STE24 endopeptidase
MNMLLIVLLLLLIGSYFFDTIVELLNLGYVRITPPKEMADIYSDKNYAKSQKYLKDTTKFGLLNSTISTVILLILLTTGFLGDVDIWLRQFTNNQIILGILFFLLAILVTTVYSLPFTLYSTFVIEEKYGFNKTTPKVFVTDTVKNLVLSMVIGAPILVAVVGFFSVLGASGWVYIWLFLTFFQIFMMFIAPVVIMPLFNKFVPLKKGKLRTEIESFAKQQKFKLEGIYTIDGSKRSTKSNAFFTGFGKYKRIALFDTLIEKHTNEELVAVLAHEIGHYQKGHIIKQLVMGIIFSGLTLFIFSLFINNTYLLSALGYSQTSIYASLVAIGLFYSPISEIFGVVQNYNSRKFEFEADAFAAQTYGKPQALIDALKKLSADNLSNLTPHPLKVFLEYSHPPVLERIKSLKTY